MNVTSFLCIILARVVGETNERRVEYFARVFVCGDNQEQSSTGTGGRLFGAGGLGTKRGETEVLAVSQDDIQLFLCTPQEWRASSVRDVTRYAAFTSYFGHTQPF